MKHLFSCLKRYRLEAVLAPIFKLFEAGMELLVPLVVRSVVNIGIADGDKGYLVHAFLLLAAFAAAGLCFAITAQYFAAKAAVGTGAELRSRLFCKLQSFSFTQIDDMGTSSMLTRMSSDVDRVQSGVNLTLRLLLRSPIVVFGATVLAFTVDWKTALVFVGLIPLLAAVVFAVMAVTVPKHRRVQEDLDGVYLSARENLTGARVIRAFRLEEKENAEFSTKNDNLRRAQERVGLISAVTSPLTFLLVNVAVVILIDVGALRVDGGALAQGDVVALYGYLSLILVELIKFANLIVTTARAVSCAGRIGAILDAEGEQETSLEAPMSEKEDGFAFSFEDVSFTYSGAASAALSHITLQAKKGETVGILGGTGSGKSTLVRLLPRFYEATEGRVLVGGRDARAVPAHKLRAKIGYVPQKVVLFAGTVGENLRWGNPDATEEELLAAAKIAQAEDVIGAKGGLSAPVEQEGRNFSGGQRQRLTIARAIVKHPDILILDDSASALDYATDARLRAALKTLDCTTVVVSQRVSSVMHADKILLLDEGRVAGMGTHEELLKGCALYREIFATQTEVQA